VLIRKDIFSRIEQLAANDQAVQSIIRSAELTFWELARTGEWLAWTPAEPEATPPHWEAAFDYLEAVVPAYVSCCGRLVRHAAELEQYIGVCVRELAGNVFEHKLLFHSQGTNWTSEPVRRRFEQAARNRLAMMLVGIRAQAWKGSQGPNAATTSPTPWNGVTGPPGTVTSESGRGVPVGRDRPTAEANGPTPVEQRREVVDRYKREFRQTVEQACKSARVNRSDFYKWVKGQLPDASCKSARIEQVLRAVLVIRSDA
jgi:hypothetical protein